MTSLWVWNGSPDDKYDLMRYVKPTEKDVLSHPFAAARISALESQLVKAREENEAHREAQAAIYLALGTGNPDRNTWPDAIRALRARDAGRVERRQRCFDPASHLPVDPNAEIYPCAKCGVLRSVAQGARVFTVCDECWEEEHPNAAADGEGSDGGGR
jgi:hypothetical protein